MPQLSDSDRDDAAPIDGEILYASTDEEHGPRAEFQRPPPPPCQHTGREAELGVAILAKFRPVGHLRIYQSLEKSLQGRRLGAFCFQGA